MKRFHSFFSLIFIFSLFGLTACFEEDLEDEEIFPEMSSESGIMTADVSGDYTGSFVAQGLEGVNSVVATGVLIEDTEGNLILTISGTNLMTFETVAMTIPIYEGLGTYEISSPSEVFDPEATAVYADDGSRSYSAYEGSITISDETEDTYISTFRFNADYIDPLQEETGDISLTNGKFEVIKQ